MTYPFIAITTPQFLKENIIGTNVGIRPYRRSGIRLELEFVRKKWIVHNYGYGTSGLTLCFGGSKEVLDILHREKVPEEEIAILGGGVAALSTTFDLLEKGYKVHLYAEAWSPHLTSNIAAGIWTPLILGEPLNEINEGLLKDSEERFKKSLSDQPEFQGVSFIDAYTLDSSGDEFFQFDHGLLKKGKHQQELALDGKIFMEDLFSKVKSRGAVLHQCRFNHLDEILALKEKVIINCTSFGSKELFNDADLIPVRGHLVYFKPQPGVDYRLYQLDDSDPNFWVSIYPWSDRLILGGVYEHGKESLEIDPKIIDKLIENAIRAFS